MTGALTLATYLVAGTIMAEADNSLESREAVAEVIACRMKESGKTALETIQQRRQFCCWDAGYNRMLTRIERWEMAGGSAWRHSNYLADLIVRGKYPLASAGNWNHFYKEGVGKAPYWAKELKNKKKIGTQWFGRLEKWRKNG